MQNMNMQSVLKAAAIGAIVNIVMGIISGLVLLVSESAGQTIQWVTSACCGWLLIPLVAGVLYGYFTPGKETVGQAAGGGAISGLVAGIAFGVTQGIINVILDVAWYGLDFGTALSGGVGTIVSFCCAAIIVGSILGAIGGAIWTAVQKN